MMIINPYRFAGGLGTLLYDTFTDTDTTALSAHTPDINNTSDVWTLVYSSNLQILSNQVKPVGSDVLYLIDVGVTDVTMLTTAFRLSNNSSSYIKFVARAPSSVNTGWGVFGARDGVLLLYEGVTSRATGTTTLVQNTNYKLEVIYSGTSIKVYLDDSLEIDHTITTTESYGTHAGIQLSKLSYQSSMEDILITNP